MRIYKDIDKDYFLEKVYRILYISSESSRNFDIKHTFISYKNADSCGMQLDDLTQEFKEYCKELDYNEECRELYDTLLKIYQGIETDDDWFPEPETKELKEVFEDRD